MSSHDARGEVRSEFATRLFILVLVVMMTVSLAVQGALAVQDHYRIKQNEKIQQFIKDQAVENHTISEKIQDCIDPEGACYLEGQKRTATAVGDINQVIVLASACSLGVDRDLPIRERQSLIQQCVIDRLAAQP